MQTDNPESQNSDFIGSKIKGYGSKNRDQVQASWLQQVIDELLYSRKKCGA